MIVNNGLFMIWDYNILTKITTLYAEGHHHKLCGICTGTSLTYTYETNFSTYIITRFLIYNLALTGGWLQWTPVLQGLLSKNTANVPPLAFDLQTDIWPSIEVQTQIWPSNKHSYTYQTAYVHTYINTHITSRRDACGATALSLGQCCLVLVPWRRLLMCR